MSIRTYFENIADAIKDKNPNITNVTPEEMPNAIRSIPSGSSSASGVTYDNTTSGLSATNVQDAIDEVVGDVTTINSDLSEFEDNISASWQPITITGTYSGTLIALYHPTLKLAMISYNSNTSPGTYNLTMNVKPNLSNGIIYGALSGNGRMGVDANGNFSIEAPVNYATGQIIFPIA